MADAYRGGSGLDDEFKRVLDRDGVRAAFQLAAKKIAAVTEAEDIAFFRMLSGESPIKRIAAWEVSNGVIQEAFPGPIAFSFEDGTLIGEALLSGGSVPTGHLTESKFNPATTSGWQSILAVPIPAPFGAAREIDRKARPGVKRRAGVCLSSRKLNAFEPGDATKVLTILKALSVCIPSYGHYVLGLIADELADEAEKISRDVESSLADKLTGCVAVLRKAFDADKCSLTLHYSNDELALQVGDEIEADEVRPIEPVDLGNGYRLQIAIFRQHPAIFQNVRDAYFTHALKVIGAQVVTLLRRPRTAMFDNIAKSAHDFQDMTLVTRREQAAKSNEIVSMLQIAYAHLGARAHFFTVCYAREKSGSIKKGQRLLLDESGMQPSVQSDGEFKEILDETANLSGLISGQIAFAKVDLGHALGLVILEVGDGHQLFRHDLECVQIAASLQHLVMMSARRIQFFAGLQKGIDHAWGHYQRDPAIAAFLAAVRTSVSSHVQLKHEGEDLEVFNGFAIMYLPHATRMNGERILGVLDPRNDGKDSPRVILDELGNVGVNCGHTGRAALYGTEVKNPDVLSQKSLWINYDAREYKDEWSQDWTYEFRSEFDIPILARAVPRRQKTSFPLAKSFRTEDLTAKDSVHGVLNCMHIGHSAITSSTEDLCRLAAVQIHLIAEHMQYAVNVALGKAFHHNFKKGTKTGLWLDIAEDPCYRMHANDVLAAKLAYDIFKQEDASLETLLLLENRFRRDSKWDGMPSVEFALNIPAGHFALALFIFVDNAIQHGSEPGIVIVSSPTDLRVMIRNVVVDMEKRSALQSLIELQPTSSFDVPRKGHQRGVKLARMLLKDAGIEAVFTSEENSVTITITVSKRMT